MNETLTPPDNRGGKGGDKNLSMLLIPLLIIVHKIGMHIIVWNYGAKLWE